MLRRLLFVVVLTLLSASIWAQVFVDKNEFAQRIVPNIQLNLENGNTTAALTDLLTLDSLFPSNPVFQYYTGLAYINSSNSKNKAAPYLAKAVAYASAAFKDWNYKDNKTPTLSLYYLARAYHLDYKLDSAISYYEQYKKWVDQNDIESRKDIDRQIEMCKNAKQVFANPTSAKIQNLGSVVNSKYDEYAPVLDALENTLIFTSRREGSAGGLIADDGKYFEDIYISNKVNGQWTKPLPIGENINSNGHEATISLSADGEQLFIYRDDMGDGNIYVSRFNGDSWGVPVKLGNQINTGARETHASVSSDGSTLYFTSDREGGFGGMDIYASKRLPNGDWGKPLNVGPEINTQYDEEGPFIHPDNNTLFFSSRGHNSIGGFDIFFTNKIPDGPWTEPQNIGFPINTADDEYFFTTSTDGKRAYFASSQPGGLGEKDLYLISLELEPEVPLTVYKGIITTEMNNLPSDVTITVNQNDELYGVFRPNTKSGRFVIILHSGKTYSISYESNGSVFHSETVEVPLNSSYFVINKEVELKSIPFKSK